MWVASTAWGFWRAAPGSQFGPKPSEFGTGGDFDNPLLNDAQEGDEAAGVQFVIVWDGAPAQGVFTSAWDGFTSWVGLPDGTHVHTGRLVTFTPGGAAAVDHGPMSLTANKGEPAGGAGGSSAFVQITATGAGQAVEFAGSGSVAAVAVSAEGAGAAEGEGAGSGGAAAFVGVFSTGAGAGLEFAQGGSSALVLITATGDGVSDAESTFDRPPATYVRRALRRRLGVILQPDD